MTEKLCLYCKKIIMGRADKKFCDIACKNAFSNAQNKIPLEPVLSINAILKKNYKILYKLYPGRPKTLPLSKLSTQGFDFKYFTSEYTNNKGERYLYCYNYGYLLLDNEQFIIVKQPVNI